MTFYNVAITEPFDFRKKEKTNFCFINKYLTKEKYHMNIYSHILNIIRKIIRKINLVFFVNSIYFIKLFDVYIREQNFKAQYS